MLCFLLLTLHWMSVTEALQSSKEDGKRPYIYRCRSPNMEIFTCWWHPIANQDNVTYTLLYTMGERAPQECPDYVSGGINSCFFDAKHTQVWEMYCMNVTAHTHTGPITSKKHCLDVVEIVETDPPFNLTYIMLNESIGEVGRSVLVSWLHPIESLVHEQLMMLVYELRYRNLAQPDNWRGMERLREPHVEFLDLPVGRYEFSVRCRTTSNKHWSVWSESIIVTINGRALSDQMLALILVTSIAIMIFIIFTLGNIPRSKSRIKSFFLPAIPKPRIPGLEPALLKKGNIDEINQHFSSFHCYKSPQYCTETWYQVSEDTSPAVTPSSIQSDGIQEDVLIRTITPCVLIGPIKQYVTCPDGQQSVQTNCTPAPYCRSPTPYCQEDTPPADPGSAQPELTSVRGMDYSMILSPAPYCVEDTPLADPGSAQPELTSVRGMDYSMILSPAPAAPPTQDFYMCVNGVTLAGTLHLVPYLPLNEGAEYEADKNSQLAALLEKQMEALLSTIESNPSEAVMPSQPHSPDRSCRSI
ncbi:growth hormone receptor-like isoform X1 [Carassius carassius]|uniref:growth hormone receptor-like isoform X1 n=1 Tax=Carassius carassius TaxID=217509 RepID=UPI002868A858|nr:growth hormone receptor-like isoform X1 [Carassius carassius]